MALGALVEPPPLVYQPSMNHRFHLPATIPVCLMQLQRKRANETAVFHKNTTTYHTDKGSRARDRTACRNRQRLHSQHNRKVRLLLESYRSRHSTANPHYCCTVCERLKQALASQLKVLINAFHGSGRVHVRHGDTRPRLALNHQCACRTKPFTLQPFQDGPTRRQGMRTGLTDARSVVQDRPSQHVSERRVAAMSTAGSARELRHLDPLI
jgi:hypothetical protein